MWTNIITGWNFIKIIRVLAGISILTSGITDNNTAFILIGSFFLLYSLITPGVCCGVYDPPPQQKASTDLKNVEYEELGVK
jgi:succinate-acetate transporter protein